MRDSGREQSQGIEALTLNCFFGGATAFRDIAQDNGVADLVTCPVRLHIYCSMLDYQRNDVEVEETIRRIENFEIARDRPAASGQRMPIQTTHPLVELLADRVLGVQSEKFTGALVHVSDFAAGIGHNDPFLDGVEDGFEESFFLRQSQQIILNIFRPDFAKAAD